MLSHPYLIPLVPAVAFVAILFFGTRLPRRGSELAVGALGINVVMALWIAVEWILGDQEPKVFERDWFSLGQTLVHAGVLVDGLSVLMLVIVSIVSLLVQLYSSTYMRQDLRYTHFFAVLTLFTAAMEWFVMSSNTLQMVFGWEVMALCSFLLIGHWWEEKHNVSAALKAFLTTRAGDVGLFVGVATLFFAAGQTFDIQALNAGASSGAISNALLMAGAVSLFVAVIGKSAQFPLHTWLPDAMAGPTPMSALIHAATMVVAGVYLLVRLFPVFDGAFGILDLSGGVNPIVIIGAITIIIAGLLAFVQRDIKKVLSYSTVAQLGYMVMAVGVGAVVPAMFHLFVHAFFKALLFLGAGNISHAVHGFDLESDMGGLRKAMPITHATFVIGSLCLIGVIPFSGFWSKTQIASIGAANGYSTFVWISVVGSLLTAGYMARCYHLAFSGERRSSTVAKEAPLGMTIPCVILAVLSLLAGFTSMSILHVDLFSSWFFPDERVQEHQLHLTTFVIEALIPLFGLAVAAAGFYWGVGPRSLARKFTLARGLYAVLHQRYYLDWLYDHLVVRGVRRGLSWLVHWVDHNVIDNAVDFSGKFSVVAGQVVVRQLDRGIVDGAVNEVGAAAQGAGGVLSKVQSGRVQRYASLMVAAVALVAVGIAVWI